MSEEKSENKTGTKKRGFLARRAIGVGGYVGRRFGNTYNNKLGYDSVKMGFKGARSAMTLETIDKDEIRRGLDGRYEDGGISRFSDMMKKRGSRMRNFWIWLVFAVVRPV